jgi:hypothetical protein
MECQYFRSRGFPLPTYRGLPARLSQAVDQIIEIPESCGGLCAICHEAQISLTVGGSFLSKTGNSKSPLSVNFLGFLLEQSR